MSTIKNMVRKCGDEHVLKGREPVQMGWYEFASTLVQGKTVLDVGCGSGEGLKVLAAKAKKAVGIDLDERLKRDDVQIEIKDISLLPERSFDVVVCIDVIEHVDDDKALVEQLVRVARETLFVSTPTYRADRDLHPYHVREYTPYQFERLFYGFGPISVLGGDFSGTIREVIRRKSVHYFLNWLYSHRVSVLIGKVLKRLLLAKTWPHQAVIVTIS